MSSERTPSRGKPCLFRRAFQRFPFGKCERRCRSHSGSSYDVRVDTAQDLPGRWSSIDMAAIGVESQIVPQEQMDSSADARIDHRTPFSGLEPVKTPSEIYMNRVDMPSTTAFTNGQVSDPFPVLDLQDQSVGLETLSQDYQYLDRMVSQTSDPVLESQTGAPPRRPTLSSSPSISSMETDGDVDPETGERALG